MGEGKGGGGGFPLRCRIELPLGVPHRGGRRIENKPIKGSGEKKSGAKGGQKKCVYILYIISLERTTTG